VVGLLPGSPLFVLCVDTGKEIVFSRLLIASPGPGYLHLPEWVDAEYLAQLTAEKAIRKYVQGRGAVREWVKLRERNEALDLEVYALAALYILGPTFVHSLGEHAAGFARPAESSETPDAEAEAPAPAPAATMAPAWRIRSGQSEFGRGRRESTAPLRRTLRR
jgi:phage terminase large subunit GpA-like protein